MSHPAWGEWIEMPTYLTYAHSIGGLTPHGVSGLKLHILSGLLVGNASHPAWGEWIEMAGSNSLAFCARSHPAWGEWIEILVRPSP